MFSVFSDYPTFLVFLAVVISAALTMALMPLWIRMLRSSHIGQQVRADGPQSHLVISRMIASEQIPLRAHIRLTWAPERVCEIVHEGNGKFSVLHSQKTKLQAGDTFECKLFIEKEPLYLYNLTHQGQEIPAYVAGKKDGIYFEYI